MLLSKATYKKGKKQFIKVHKYAIPGLFDN